jgi:predicted flap endonuclease-1-like 5' DNA nuclease
VYRYRQIADWTPENVENYALRLDVGERIQREEWVKQSAELAELVEAEESDEVFVAPAWVDYNAVVRQHFAGESGLRVDSRWGIVYDQKPDWVDDLKQIDGIGPKLERVLNRHGVYQFRQISHWSDATVAVFAEALGVSKERIDRGKWVPQARRLERETAPVETEWGDRQPSLSELQERAAREFPGEDIEVDESYGIVYVIRPDEVDNIKLVKGIGATFAERLHSVGVYRFKQIALWGDGNVEAFARLLGTHRHRIYREGWIRQAREMASAPRRPEPAPVERNYRGESRLEDVLRRDLRGEDAVVNPELGIIFRTPPREVDDLKKIRGIGQKLENSLNDHGVYQFRQIALWNRANAEEFSRRLECFADRMFRDQWIEQARKLHADKYGMEV